MAAGLSAVAPDATEPAQRGRHGGHGHDPSELLTAVEVT